MTPAPLAQFMASLFKSLPDEIVLLDPGAGIGILTSAFVEHAVRHVSKSTIHVHAYEVDAVMLRHLKTTMEECDSFCKQIGVDFQWHIHAEDFIEAGVQSLVYEYSLFGEKSQRYSHCIMNPPYRKIKSDSSTRAQLQQIGIETSNLYTGFLAIAVHLLEAGGELVAIVPRSFCNGVYFKSFRKFF